MENWFLKPIDFGPWKIIKTKKKRGENQYIKSIVPTSSSLQQLNMLLLQANYLSIRLSLRTLPPSLWIRSLRWEICFQKLSFSVFESYNRCYVVKNIVINYAAYYEYKETYLNFSGCFLHTPNKNVWSILQWK